MSLDPVKMMMFVSFNVAVGFQCLLPTSNMGENAQKLCFFYPTLPLTLGLRNIHVLQSDFVRRSRPNFYSSTATVLSFDVPKESRAALVHGHGLAFTRTDAKAFANDALVVQERQLWGLRRD